jgi:hypothetical protein
LSSARNMASDAPVSRPAVDAVNDAVSLSMSRCSRFRAI